MNQIAINNIGDVLAEIGKVTQDDLDRAIEVQKQTGQKLGRILIDLGTVSEEDLRLAYRVNCYRYRFGRRKKGRPISFG